MSHTGEEQCRGGEELSHMGEELGRGGEGEDAIAGEVVAGPAAPDQSRAGGNPQVASRARSRAARVESEGYPRQRAVSCIQSMTYEIIETS